MATLLADVQPVRPAQHRLRLITKNEYGQLMMLAISTRLDARYCTTMPARNRFFVPIALEEVLAADALTIVWVQHLHPRRLFAALNVRRSLLLSNDAFQIHLADPLE